MQQTRYHGGYQNTVLEIISKPWVGGFSTEGTCIGGVLFPYTKSKRGLFVIHYTWKFIWFVSFLETHGVLNEFAARYNVLVIEECVNKLKELMPLLINLRHRGMDIIVSVVSISDAISFENFGFNSIVGGAAAWVDDKFFYDTKTSKKWDLLIVSTGKHNNATDVKNVRRVLNVLRADPYTKDLSILWVKGDRISRNTSFIVETHPKLFVTTEYVTQIELRKLYNESRCYVLMSEKEGANRSLTEALLCNVPALINQDFRNHYLVETSGKNSCVAVQWNEFSRKVLQIITSKNLSFVPRLSVMPWVLSSSFKKLGYIQRRIEGNVEPTQSFALAPEIIFKRRYHIDVSCHLSLPSFSNYTEKPMLEPLDMEKTTKLFWPKCAETIKAIKELRKKGFVRDIKVIHR